MLTSASLKHTGTRSSWTCPRRSRTGPRVRHHLLSRLRDRVGDSLDAVDRATLDQLLDPGDEASVHRRGRVHTGGAHVYTAQPS